MKSYDKPNRGFTLITILFVIVLLFIYVVSLLSISRGIMNISSHERDYASSFAGAEAGLTRAIYEINENNYWPGNTTNPMWGQGFLSWQPLSDGITQYEIKAYNNFNGSEDRNTDSGDRVPIGSIQVVSTGRLAPNDSQSTIKTFLKPNAKIPACLAGAISPVRHLLPCVIGTKKILDYAMSLSPDKIIIDTTGFVIDSAAIALKQAKIELLNPDFIFAFSRGKELEPVLYPYYSSCNIRKIEINENVTRKTQEFRASERNRKFLSYFKYSKKLRINLQSTAISGINYIPGGNLLHTNELRWLSSAVDFPVAWGEKAGDRLIIGVSHMCELKNIHEIKSHYAVSSVDIIEPLMFLAGFFCNNDECLSIGVITDFRPEKGFMEILSPFAGNVEDIKRLHIGSYRLPEDIYEEMQS